MQFLSTDEIQDLIKFHKDKGFLNWLKSINFDLPPMIEEKTFDDLKLKFNEYRMIISGESFEDYEPDHLEDQFCSNCGERFFGDESLCGNCAYEYDPDLDEEN